MVEPASRAETASLGALVAEQTDELKQILSDKGAALFRGFEVGTIKDFKEVVGRFACDSLMNYAGGASPRFRLDTGVYTSTEYPPNLSLELHNELSYTARFPQYIYFYCLIPPAENGETTLGDSRWILANIDGSVRDEFQRRGVRYIRTLTSDAASPYSWQSAFETSIPAEAEYQCEQLGAGFEWLSDRSLRVSQIRPATIRHPHTDQEAWFNQATAFHPSALVDGEYERQRSAGAFRLNSEYGDGSDFSPDAIRHIREVINFATYKHEWQRRDILVIDNLVAAHGRAPFKGPRSIAVAMS